MNKHFFGLPISRNEDRDLLTGRALFVDDVQIEGMLHAAFWRCPEAHARIERIDVSAARRRTGVAAVYTAEDLGDLWRPGPLLVSPPPVPGLVFHQRTQYPLARTLVRHAGEAVAVVVADSRYQAEDALADIKVEFEPLPAVVDLKAALRPETPLVHADLGSNLAAHVLQQKGNFAEAKGRCDLLIQRRFRYDRGVAAALENRGVVAHWDAKSRHLTVWDTTQAPIPIRNGLAQMLGLSEFQVDVIAPFIGGGFGPKIMMFYPEELVIPWASLRLLRPIKWIEDRQENFYATTQEREQVHEAAMALSREGEILGIEDSFLFDTGAYNPYGLTIPINSQCTILGPYRVPSYSSEFKAVFTNKPIVTPVRGAGRQHGVFVVERLLDLAARELGLDRLEIRKQNLLPADAFPHDHEILFQDFAPLTYDSGNYVVSLEKAAEMIGYQQFVREEQPCLRAAGRKVGVGIVCYVEGTGIGPYEGVRVNVESSGKVNVATGVGTQGQGHFTMLAQIVADALGVEVGDVHVVTGDTRHFHWGTGTFASRGAVVAGNAAFSAARAVRQKALRLASQALGVPRGELEVAGGSVRVKKEPARQVSLSELVVRANPLRGAVKWGTEPGLEATAYFGPERGSTANGAHALVLEIDPETFQIKILRYVVVHDCGKIINPLIVEGQIEGGVAQGIGNCYFEQLVFDDHGQILNASLMDYLLPTALDVPRVESDHVETSSPLNELGVKGAGEAGAIPVGALFAQAVEDALWDVPVEITEIPLSPNRLYELVRDAGSGAAGEATSPDDEKNSETRSL